MNTGRDLIVGAYGPDFRGGPYTEFTFCSYPFNEKHFYSYSNMPGYKIPLDGKDINQLTNSTDKASLNISELEVWQL